MAKDKRIEKGGGKKVLANSTLQTARQWCIFTHNRFHTNLSFMKRAIVIAFLLANLSGYAQSAEQTKVNQSLTQLFDALAALDMNGIRQFSTKDLMVLESGVVWNLDTLAKKIDNLKGSSFSRVNHLDFIQTEVRGNTAWVVYHNTADMVINGLEVHAKWLESAVLLMEEKVWKVKLLHSTTLMKK
jgi:ketosteroid isomerase-like protein